MKKFLIVIVIACLAVAFSVFAKVKEPMNDENLSFREKISAQFK